MEQLRAEPQEQHNLAMDWTWDGDETDEEAKIRAEAQNLRRQVQERDSEGLRGLLGTSPAMPKVLFGSTVSVCLNMAGPWFCTLAMARPFISS